MLKWTFLPVRFRINSKCKNKALPLLIARQDKTSHAIPVYLFVGTGMFMLLAYRWLIRSPLPEQQQKDGRGTTC